MYMKIHEPGGVVAICDEELIGKVFSDGKRKLDLAAYKDFYIGKKVGLKEAVEALKSAQSANLVGSQAIQAARKAGLDVSGAVLIGGVLHLQVYRL
ncbi:MAG: DUF424 family protein [Candidatus Micrarchaeota archaeon]|nr:DUF424 family protein [Candidatus Micrarchaeota archaeon]